MCTHLFVPFPAAAVGRVGWLVVMSVAVVVFVVMMVDVDLLLDVHRDVNLVLLVDGVVVGWNVDHVVNTGRKMTRKIRVIRNQAMRRCVFILTLVKGLRKIREISDYVF